MRFDWTFSASANGELLWNGTTAWAGGHAWYVTISNLTLVPVPWLEIARAGIASVELAWATNFPSHVLEYTDALPAPAWTTVTNAATNADTRLSVTLEMGATNRFYHLRKP